MAVHHMYYGYHIDMQKVNDEAYSRMRDEAWGWSTIVHHHAADTSCEEYRHVLYTHGEEKPHELTPSDTKRIVDTWDEMKQAFTAEVPEEGADVQA